MEHRGVVRAGPAREDSAATSEVPAPAGSQSAAFVMMLQGQVGNAVVSRMLASRAAIARQPPTAAPPGTKSPAAEAEELIAGYTTLGALDEEGLARAMAGFLPDKEPMVLAVFTKLSSHNRDDVALELAKVCQGRLASLSRAVRLQLIRELVAGVVPEDEEEQIAELWKSFGPRSLADGAAPGDLGAVAAAETALWRKSLHESDALVEYTAPVLKEFKRDVKGVARVFLAANRKVLHQEGERMGIQLSPGAGKPVVQNDYMTQIMNVATHVNTIQEQRDELKDIVVGRDRSDGMSYVAHFDPEGSEPEIPPPEGKPTWKETKQQWDQATSVIAGFANLFPTIYALLQQKRLGELAKAGDAAQGAKVIEETLRKTDSKISEAEEKIGPQGAEGDGPIAYTDLVPIHSKLMGGVAIEGYAPRVKWSDPFFQGIAKDDLDKDTEKNFWTALALDVATAAALIAAPFTGGATAALLVGGTLAVDAARAAESWQKYSQLKDLGQAGVRDELALVSEGQVSGALTEAIMNSLALFLDAFGAKSAAAGGRKAIEAAEAAQAKVGEEAAAQARKRAAVKDAAQTGAMTGAAIAVHELEDQFDVVESAVLQGPWISFDMVDPEATSRDSRTLAPKRKLARQPLRPGDPGYVDPRQFGSLFESQSQGALLRGEIGQLPRFDHVFPGQFNRSGHGIDLIGVSIDRQQRRFSLHRFDCKYVGPEGMAKLGTGYGGVQYGPAWNAHTIEEFLKADYASSARVMLIDAVAGATGRRPTVARIGEELHRSPVGIIHAVDADIRRLAAQVMALRRWNIKASLHGLPVRR